MKPIDRMKETMEGAMKSAEHFTRKVALRGSRATEDDLALEQLATSVSYLAAAVLALVEDRMSKKGGKGNA